MRTCCCFSLRTGGLIVGWLGVIGVIVNILMLCEILCNFNPHHSKAKTDEISLKLAIGFTSDIIGLILSALLINGILRHRHRDMVPWLIANCIGLLIIGFSVLYGVVMLLHYGQIEASLGVLLIGGLIFGFQCFVLMAMLSLYNQIKMSRIVDTF